MRSKRILCWATASWFQQVDVKSQFIPVLDGFRVGIHQHFQPIEKLGLVLLYAADAKPLLPQKVDDRVQA